MRLENGQAALFGYGSLILLESMEKTLGRKYSFPRYPCYLRGWRRIWNSLYPNTAFYALHPGGGLWYPANILYLNIRRSDTILNGIVYVVDEADLAAFDKREYVYDRMNVTSDISGLEIAGGTAWAYVGKDPFVMSTVLPVEQAAIRSSYLQIVDRGLEEFGQEFRRQYEDSSDPIPASSVIDDQRRETQ